MCVYICLYVYRYISIYPPTEKMGGYIILYTFSLSKD